MSTIDRSPTRSSSAAACAVAAVAAIAAGLYSWLALAVGVLGLAIVAVGVTRGSRRAVTVGSAGLFVAAVVAGLQGAAAGVTLFGTVAAVLAWDAGTTAIGLGRQLGREASTRRVELVHLAASASVGAVTIVVGYLLYALGTGGQPLSALLLLVVAAVVLLAAIGRE